MYAQTEARASLWAPAKPEHAKLGWTYDFEQTERISRAARDGTGYDATLEVVEFVMAEADRRHATALAAKDAELERRDMQLEASAKVALDLSAQLAEANKALEELIQIAGTLSGYFRRFPEQVPDEEFVEVCNGDLRAVYDWLQSNGRNPLQERTDISARRAREAQGGE